MSHASRFMSLVLALASATAFGETTREVATGNHNWNDADAWSPAGVPADDEGISFNMKYAGEDRSIVLTNDVTTAIRATGFTVAPSGKDYRARFTGTNCVYAPALPSNPPTYPQIVRASNSDRLFCFSGTTSQVPFTYVDFDMDTRRDADGFESFNFLRGAFNYWDPDGTPTTRTISLFAGDHGTATSENPMRVMFGPGTTFKLPAITMSGAADNTTDPTGDKALVFNGATGSVASLTYKPGWPRTHEMSVILTNGADLTVGKMEPSNPGDAYGTDGQPMRHRLVVEDSRLTATNGWIEFYANNSHIGYDVLFNRATIRSFASGNGLYVGTTGSAASDGNRFLVKDSTIVSSNASIFVGSDASSPSAGKNALEVSFDRSLIVAKGLSLRPQTSALGFTNCVIDLCGGTFSHQLDTASSMKTAYFKDTVITNGTLAANGYAGGSSRLVFDGGRQHFTGWSNYTPQNAELVITNGADFTEDASMQYWGNDGDSVRTQVITVAKGGSFTCKKELGIGFNGNYTKVYMGFHVGPDATAMIGNSIYCGYLGNGHVVVDGGTVNCADVWVGAGGSDACKDQRGLSTFVIKNGGSVFGKNYFRLGCKTGTGHDGKLILDDGGLLAPDSLYGQVTEGVNTAEVWANGGIVKGVTLSGFSKVALGPKGLTHDPNGNNLTLYQVCTNQPGTAGLYRLAGANGGSVTLTASDWFVANTVVDGLTLTLKTSFVSDTALVATNGATLTVTSSSTPTVGALTVRDSTLVIDPGSTLTVTGAVDFANLTFKVTTNPSTTVTNDVLVIRGELSDASAQALARAILSNTLPSGTYGMLLPVYDKSTKKTTVRFQVGVRESPLTETTTWKGVTGDLWNDAANGWTDGVPAATNRAIFAASETAAKAVTVPAGATIGAIDFTGTGYLLAGETLNVKSLTGAAIVSNDAAAVTNEIAADVWVQNGVELAVGATSQLKVSGGIDASTLAKTGKGELVLTGANAIGDTVSFEGGRTIVDAAAALGAAVNDRASVKIVRDTLQIDSGDDSETVIDQPFQMAVTNRRTWVILDCKTPVTINNWKSCSTGGGLIKRGQGKLTIKVKDGQNLSTQRARRYNTNSQDTSFAFAEDGSGLETTEEATTINYASEIAPFEGETVIAAADGETGVPKVKMSAGAFDLGFKCTQGSGLPTLTFDGVDFSQPSDIFTFGLSGSGYAKTGLLKLVNGARFNASYVAIATACWDGNRHAYVAMTNATLQSQSQLWLTFCNVDQSAVNGTTWAEFYVKDSALLSNGGYMGWGVNYGISINADCGVKGYFDNTFFGAGTTTAPYRDTSKYATLYLNRGAFGELVFSNGSVFQVNKLDTTTWVPVHSQWYTANFKLAFDDATWNYGTTDFTLAASCVAAADRSHFQIEMRNAGVRLAPEAGTTFTTEYPFTGEGGLIVDGPGTVKFAEDTLQFTGAVDLRQGTLDAGGQTIAAKISHVTGTSAPTLKDCAVSGTVLVDLADSSVKEGDVLTVAHLSGTAAPSFKAVNAPAGLRGRVSVADNAVTLRVTRKPGVVLIIR